MLIHTQALYALGSIKQCLILYSATSLNITSKAVFVSKAFIFKISMFSQHSMLLNYSHIVVQLINYSYSYYLLDNIFLHVVFAF